MTQVLPAVVVANLHRRYTGVSATVCSLLPLQRRTLAIGLLDTGRLGLAPAMGWWDLVLQGWSPPPGQRWRVWHARRDLEILLGVLLRSVLRQPWRVLFTSAAPKPPGPVLGWLIQRCDAVIATSERSAAFLPPGCVTATIHHGVDTAFFSPDVSPDGAPPALAPLLSGRQGAGLDLIGCFGRIRPSKGTDLVVEALIAALPDRPRYGAFFTGLARPADLPYLERLRQRIAAAGLGGRILFLGDLDRRTVRDCYRRTRLCVAASRREGFGLTPLEAMACGCAVLTSQEGVWPELIDGAVGRRFATGSAASLTQELIWMLDHPAELAAMGQRARQRALTRNSLQNEAEAINGVYQALLAGGISRCR
ncbi:glycosyltransferase family 4 protein [Cyanobium sp. NIES-981]|uniref:glycosyltransferase family 4 protein n=1 Tax=Cyanobium sp. NIES-981 TaxID=1851505 RepID=UPI0007DD50D9|nr:glycosyltransferase family 4 protein [Cyanobium sp. NIES-981]SBO43833.1 Lipopolysaccharide core biosynthesis mannosyltransferase LpcC [Cyanobium sp. NIES-981]